MVDFENRSAAYFRYVSTGSAESCRSQPGMGRDSAHLPLARLEAAVGLVDHIGPATAANHAVIAVAVLERLEAVANLNKTLGAAWRREKLKVGR
jgi:hypothetical protein